MNIKYVAMTAEQTNSAQRERQIAATDATKEQLGSLICRIKESHPLNKAPRLRVLFEYLCAHAVNHPDVPLGEQQIGVEVFGRAPGYSNEDTIVRVQVSQLRRRLKEYFVDAGADEPILIEIPAGSYVPQFIRRQAEEMPAEDAANSASIPQSDLQVSVPRRRRWLIAAGLAAAFGLGIGLAAAWHTFHGQGTRVSNPQPYLRAFWDQFFNGQAAEIIPPDSGALVIADIAGHEIDMKDYVGRIYTDEILTPVMRSKPAQGYISGMLDRGAISVDQVRLLEQLWTALARLGYPVETVSPRGFDVTTPLSHNLILFGHSRAIPGETPLADTLNFQFRFDDKQRRGMIVNVAPQQDEQPAYIYKGSRGPSYAVLAFLRRTGSQGNVLFLYGANMSFASGAIDLITNEAEMEHLYQVLHLHPGDQVPSFEVLLEREPGASKYQVIAYRTYQ